MSHLTCPGCGSVYPMESVRAYDRFQCAVCHKIIVVPMAGPSAARATQQAEAPPPIPVPRRRRASRFGRKAVAGTSTRAAAESSAPGRATERVGEPRRMKPIAGHANALTALTVIVLLAVVFDVGAHWKVIEFLDGLRAGFQAGRPPDMDRANDLDTTVRNVTIGLLIAWGLYLVGLCAWFHRAQANLWAAKLPRIEYGAGWAIGGFFVPILNFVRPAQVMSETWAGTSYLAGKSRTSSWKRSPSSPLVAAWWGLWIFAVVLSQTFRVPTLADAKTQTFLTMAWLAVFGVDALVGLTLVRQITDLQESARRRG